MGIDQECKTKALTSIVDIECALGTLNTIIDDITLEVVNITTGKRKKATLKDYEIRKAIYLLKTELRKI